MAENKKPLSLRNKILTILIFFKDRFDLHEGKEDELETIDYIKKNVEFRGAKSINGEGVVELNPMPTYLVAHIYLMITSFGILYPISFILKLLKQKISR